MKIINCEQGSPEWHTERRNRITGRKLDKVMGGSTAQFGLICDLIAEEATEQSKIIRASAEMERGNNEEPFAIKMFEGMTGKKVDRLGLCISNEFDWIALSPDGFIKDKKGKYTEALEIKSPDSATAVYYKLTNLIPLEELGMIKKNGECTAAAPFCGIPSEYKWQVIHYFIVNQDLETLHFGIYDGRFINGESQLYIVSVNRTDELIQSAITEAKSELLLFREKWMKYRDIALPSNF